MRHIFTAFVIFCLNLYANIDLDFTTFQADFIQQIDDGNKKIVSYKGKIYAKKPKTALWKYTKPIQKSVYIKNKRVIIVEPELEQVIIRHIKGDFDIFSLLKSAKKVSKNRYEAVFEKIHFMLYFDGKKIQKLTYKDSFENLVTITFSNQKYDVEFSKDFFTPKYPVTYDLIVE